MKQHVIAGIVLTILFVIFLGMYLSSYPKVSPDVLVFLLSILQVISLFFVFFSTPTTPENFFFEVSPERKRCLVEQVAPIKNRSCSCCQKGTVGGYPPYYADWLQPEGKNELWKRTDNWTTNPDNVAYTSQLPATEYVKQMKKK